LDIKRSIRHKLGTVATELYLGDDLLGSALLQKLLLERKCVIVADVALKNLYAAELAAKLGAKLLTVPSGELAKRLETATHLIDQLLQMGVDKETTVIALGGGVTIDLVGFVASICLRGLPLILIPTTLLAMVDAAVGGKTAIDTAFGKNLIGTLYDPEAIVIDVSFLKTLPEKEWMNGLGEILKMGLIYDPSILALAEKNPKDQALVVRAVEGKIAIVEQDPKERGLRRILNFGHTIGHALETVSQYEIAHGEAVAIGSLAESYLSMRLGYLSKEEFDQIEKLYKRLPLQLPRLYAQEKLLDAFRYDKKNINGQVRVVLIDRIGHAMEFDGNYCLAVSQERLKETLDWLEKVYL